MRLMHAAMVCTKALSALLHASLRKLTQPSIVNSVIQMSYCDCDGVFVRHYHTDCVAAATMMIFVCVCSVDLCAGRLCTNDSVGTRQTQELPR